MAAWPRRPRERLAVRKESDNRKNGHTNSLGDEITRIPGWRGRPRRRRVTDTDRTLDGLAPQFGFGVVRGRTQ
jgi:hypothetical protein